VRAEEHKMVIRKLMVREEEVVREGWYKDVRQISS
jgi:hypothetical protein